MSSEPLYVTMQENRVGVTRTYANVPVLKSDGSAITELEIGGIYFAQIF